MAVLVSQSLDPTAEHGGVIAGLSHELDVPLHEVREIYREQLERLAADARIQSFRGVLAMCNTRDILRAADRRAVALCRT